MTDQTAVADYGTSFDPILILASALDAVPGSHAVLLGAGVSIAAGVPSAWGVEQELIRRMATAEGAGEPADPHAWYRQRFGVDASYEGLLAAVGPTQHDRQAVLRGLFEPDTLDESRTRPVPTAAHLALAGLAATGAVRVFLTLNFDHLMEQALRTTGIEPVIVRSAADLAGLAPLHTLPALVVHLHGDYLTATAMRNTRNELETYESELVDFLRVLMRERALLAVGWSAEHDTALRDVVRAHLLQRFTSYWVTLDPLGPLATELATAERITHITGDADEVIGRLCDGHAAIQARHSRHPATLADAVYAMKRQLGGPPPAIDAHDRLRRELAALRDLPDLAYPGSLDQDDYETVAARVDEASLPAASLIATAAYWGNPGTDAWWAPELRWFTARNRGSGLTDRLDLPRRAGTVLYQAAAVAAVAAQRFDLLMGLFTLDDATNDPHRQFVAERLAAAHNSVFGRAPSAAVADLLRAIFSEHIALGQRAFESAWEMHDILLATHATFSHNRFPERFDQFVEARERLRQLDAQIQANGRGDSAAQQERSTAWQDAGRALRQVADLAPIWGSHIRAGRVDLDSMVAPGAETLSRQVEADGPEHRLIRARFADGDTDRFIVALQGVSRAAGIQGHETSWRDLRSRGGHGGAMASYLWIDTGQEPDL